MKKNLTEIVFILDRSGSMSGLESDTIGGFNSMLKKQKQQEGEAFVSTIMFSNDSEVIHDRIPISKVGEMTDRDYCVGGCTALLDAIGYAVEHIMSIHKYAREEDVPEHTIFVITTDGLENASHKFSSDEVKKLIEQQKEKGWEFLFLGANIDAVETARHFGISEDRAVRFHNDKRGIEVNYSALSDAVCCMRAGSSLKPSWKKRIEADFEERSEGDGSETADPAADGGTTPRKGLFSRRRKN